MKIYYAHPVTLYGSKQELIDRATLLRLGFEIIDPNTPECDAGYKAEGMEYFRKIVASCGAVAFRGFTDGTIPAGIAKEIEMAKALELPVIELAAGLIRRTLSVEQTREALLESGRR